MAEDRRHEQAEKIGRQVDAALDRGNLSSAKAAFTRSWREAVPELPARFSTILVHLDRRAVAALLERMRRNSGRKPHLKLSRNDEGRVAVVTSRGERLELGCLPHEDVKMLEELDALDDYRPRLLEVRHDESGSLRYVAVELVRPVPRKPCSSCGARHSHRGPLCDDCYAASQDEGKRGVIEHTPVRIQEAIEQIASESGLDDDGEPLDF